MSIIPVSAFSDNYIWIITDEAAGVFDCVDPGDAEPVLYFAKTHQLNLRSILLTHHHHDHIGGVHDLTYNYPHCEVYGPHDARIPYINHCVQADQMIQIGNYFFRILYNPGHTSTHISYYEPHQGWLFCGDTLFSAGCGRVFDGTLSQLYQSMQLFKSLPEDTKVFCAHEYTVQNLRFAQTVEPQNTHIHHLLKRIGDKSDSCTLPSTIKEELLINPFLRTDTEEVRHYALKHGAASIDSLEIFRILREQKNSFK